MPLSKEDFAKVFAGVSGRLVEELPAAFEMPPHAVRWVQELLEGAVPGGKMTRGLTVVHSLEAFVGDRELTAEEVQKACVLGWCIEWLQGFFLVADDIMDQSKTRRGNLCWYRREKPIDGANGETVDLIACNDSLLIEGTMYRILKLYLKGEPYYMDVVEMFLETSYQTELGQLLDLTSQPNTKTNNLDLFTLDVYKKIVKYKTAFYSFYLPVALAMAMAGLNSEKNLELAKSILLPMGEYFQVQDDYLDCYGAPEVIGKIGTDIEENKCGWLVVQALQRVTAEQRAVLEQHYGKSAPEDVAAVKQLYRDLDLTAVFKQYEEESFASLCALIDDADTELTKEPFRALLKKIYKRSL